MTYYGNSYDCDLDGPEPLPAVLRCPKCGCFVSWKPESASRALPSKTHWEQDKSDPVFSVEIIDEWEDFTYPYWECKRCKNGTEEPETWT